MVTDAKKLFARNLVYFSRGVATCGRRTLAWLDRTRRTVGAKPRAQSGGPKNNGRSGRQARSAR
ncbi:hypothetical protein BN2475_230055 [Paraburkholderia ribeironis]|uniref:Uncharacterized protein n=1 Tax=Paraburkholderia ribeironis TaxID=1247936 RepID=A0A1N7RXR6_9BURK|nr:hypothetical protein BN2475_230055 [Paraburkholderia ribeironis]